VGRRSKTNISSTLQEAIKMNMRLSSQGGIIVTLKELIDMHRVGFKYKINHNTKDLIAFRSFLDNEIKRRKESALNDQKNISENHKQT
jgi:hypothetical protein